MMRLESREGRASRARRRRWVSAVALLGLLLTGSWGLGCASPPDRTKLERARAEIQAARDSGVEADSVDLDEAVRRLEESQKLVWDRADQARIDHEAELALLYARVAVVRGEAQAAVREADAYLSEARVSTAGTRANVEAAIQHARVLDAEQTERGLVLTLGGVLFEVDSSNLTQETRVAVARVAGFLIALDDREALVEGHADSTGRADYNQQLSMRRAASIVTALVEFGVEPGRMLAAGYGARFPVASNETEEGREQNRRVEIVILKPGASADASRRR